MQGREIHNMEFVISSSIFTNIPVMDQLRMVSMNRKRKKDVTMINRSTSIVSLLHYTLSNRQYSIEEQTVGIRGLEL